MNIDKKQLNIAKKYSEAFFEIAAKYNCVEKFYQELESVTEVFKTSPDLKEYLENNTISKNDKKDVIYKVFSKDFDIQIINLLNLLADNKRVNILDTVCYLYKEKYEDSKNQTRVEIVSAIPLDKNTKVKLIKKLEEKTGKSILPEYIMDTEIIGGLVIHIQGKTVDLSLKSKFNEMKKQLIKG